MQESNSRNYYLIKFMIPIIGLISILTGIWFLIDPNAEVTVNQVKRLAQPSDAVIPFIIGTLAILYFIFISNRLIRIKVDSNCIEFTYKNEKIIKEWADIEKLIKFWAASPPLYCIKFENENKYYFFSTGKSHLMIPFYVFDLSEMGKFINKRKKDIPFLKIIRDEKNRESTTSKFIQR